MFKKALKWLAIITGILLILVILFALFILNGFRTQTPTCKPGVLLSIEKCDEDHAFMTWMGSGWWYTLATGPLDPALCTAIGTRPTTLNIQTWHKTITQKTDCAVVGFSNATLCYAIQSLSSNGNTRHVDILAIQDCAHAQLFQGSKARMIGGNPEKDDNDWITPYPDMPTLENTTTMNRQK